MGLQAEDLAFDSGITCDMCSESVNYGEDYVTHLSIVHNINKNFNFFLNKARDSIKGGHKRKADVITLSDEEEEESSNNHEGPNVPQIDEDVKRRIVNVVEKTMSEMLDPIKKLLEGKVPLETDNLSTEDFDEDPAAADEKIWDAFNKLKMSINDLEFPEEMLQSLASGNSQQEEQKKTLQATVTKKDPPAATKKDDKFKLPSTTTPKPLQPQRKGAKKSQTQENKPQPPIVSANNKDGGKISDPDASSQAQVRPGTAKPSPRRTNTPVTSARGASPAKSDKSARSGTSSKASSASPSAKTRMSRFCCPIKDCTFLIDKAGLTGGEAAKHITRIHKVTPSVMEKAPKGFYKFKKVKAETGA